MNLTENRNQCEEKVLNWIVDNFYLEELVIEDFRVLPYGKRIIDKNGDEMVVFFDYFKQSVEYFFPSN
jgi:hypothetical protein